MPIGKTPKSSHFNPRSPWGERPAADSGTFPVASDFNPRSPWGERPTGHGKIPAGFRFQSTLPVGGATASSLQETAKLPISIHAPRGGSDGKNSEIKTAYSYFNPRSPWGERPELQSQQFGLIFISIHAPRGGSDVRRMFHPQVLSISIHAPRGGSDRMSVAWYYLSINFNPRSPWGERHGKLRCTGCQRNFNPRSPWGERHCPFALSS